MANMRVTDEERVYDELAIILGGTREERRDWLEMKYRQSGMGQNQFARYLRIDNGYLSQLLSGKKGIGKQTALQIASRLIFFKAEHSTSAAMAANLYDDLTPEHQEIIMSLLNTLLKLEGKDNDIKGKTDQGVIQEAEAIE